ncbi:MULTISPECIES: HAMP domain-containing sensor histidine kinase [unclassified Sphingopyxis]|jgi:signal transduction histidine kinase|uniref:sensor histidine kinase n=1 Tax=unclassified Sphingopyxis TaxID=2614943 RepID=UPI0006C203B6|nr:MULTISPECIES: HAMP domain-containing sensor histidine kinase [unclassified Sphingopyxis]USI75476.1 HAMP domain-containing histidine kinase [Sphingopyxis sp. USTB-05]GAO78017.1 osmosensitive K+ channel histidine kinase KdpD [Sphingopyxis sp. C-1]
MKLRLWPKSLIGQLVFAVAVMLFVAQAINFVLLSRGMKQQALAHGGGMAVARVIDAIERDRRGDFRRPQNDAEARERAQKLVISDTAPPVPVGAVRLPDLAKYVSGLLDETNIQVESVDAWALPPRERQRLRRPEFPDRAVIVVAKVDGRYFAVRSRIAAGGNRLQGFLVWQTLSLYLLLLVPIMFIAWRAARPLRDLTRAARANPALRDAEPLEEEGPSDVRDLIGAFNAYRGRITTMLSDKDRMLGAVGHDLRTPLASLRVRVEQVDDDALRDKMIASIEEMTAMLSDILALARSGAGTEAQERIPLRELVGELVADYQERGKDVAMDDIADANVLARPMLLKRALRNLTDNAVAYGIRARLSVRNQTGRAQIVISDDGPGLTEEQIRTLVEPFARGEQSRNRATGGAGLGLSIARDIAEGEGGGLTLRNRVGRGLDAIIDLPVQA